MIKEATTLLINKKGKGKKESERERLKKIHKKGPNFGFCACVKNKKAVLISQIS